jgi:hypothetical protein
MKQLTFTTIGGEVVTSQQRSKTYVQPRGYAYFPGTGPEGETCGSCQHISKGRRWSKCKLRRHTWSNGRGTDILVRAAACKFWIGAESVRKP